MSGRAYPVEIRWRPIHEDDADEEGAQEHAIAEALEELVREGPGDVLVFLSSEREIRETAETLAKRFAASIEILPLFGRLAASDQHRVFHPGGKRRVVLATNIAETSLTVPGIRYVIDTGFARISRFNPRTKVQRLPIEPVSQASADQRAGRCGRLGPGICIRLYSEEDYQERERFTPPEILRTNLASVILQMKVMGLGDLESFPFLDPPDARAAREGVRLLQDLRALDDAAEPTEIGRQLARFPVDPRIGRIVLAGRDEGCLPEALVAAAALSVVDPRERPADNPAAADEAQARFADPRSDFLAYLALWDELQEKLDQPTRGPLRRWSRESFLSYTRLREWTEVHRQLVEICREIPALRRAAEAARRRVAVTSRATTKRATPVAAGDRAPSARSSRDDRIDGPGYAPLHRALLTGLLANVGLRDEERSSYQGASGKTFFVFPGSALFKKPPKWILAAELVETTRLYGRTCARIDPRWIEDVGAHLVKRSYSDPWWDEAGGRVLAKERVTFSGLPVEAGRPVDYGAIDPVVAREVFLRGGLVEGTLRTRGRFLEHNRKLVEQIIALEDRARRRDIFAGEEALYAFYAERVPPEVHDTATFEAWRRQAEAAQPDLLHATRSDLVREGAVDLDPAVVPRHLARRRRRAPAVATDSSPATPPTASPSRFPLAALANLRPEPFEWLVPGYLPEKVNALLRALPKSQRKRFLPLAATADAFLDRREATKPSLEARAARLPRAARPERESNGGESAVRRRTPARLPAHELPRRRRRRRGGRRRPVACRAAGAPRQARAPGAADPRRRLAMGALRHRDVGLRRAARDRRARRRRGRIVAYPALADRGGSVDLVLAPSQQAASVLSAHRRQPARAARAARAGEGRGQGREQEPGAARRHVAAVPVPDAVGRADRPDRRGARPRRRGRDRGDASALIEARRRCVPRDGSARRRRVRRRRRSAARPHLARVERSRQAGREPAREERHDRATARDRDARPRCAPTSSGNCAISSFAASCCTRPSAGFRAYSTTCAASSCDSTRPRTTPTAMRGASPSWRRSGIASSRPSRGAIPPRSRATPGSTFGSRSRSTACRSSRRR